MARQVCDNELRIAPPPCGENSARGTYRRGVVRTAGGRCFSRHSCVKRFGRPTPLTGTALGKPLQLL